MAAKLRKRLPLLIVTTIPNPHQESPEEAWEVACFEDSKLLLTNPINGFSRKIVPNFSEIVRKIWQSKFSEMAFFAETAGNGVWDLVGDANSDPMVYKSSKSAFWKRKIQFSVKIRKIRKFGTISCESPVVSA